ncbi:MAG TPA: hypothetical protein VMV17_19095 [Streptosporangiaceae bacterium]|nr:hypothetical protein [Streptosporangiaceae bacterium]
MPPSDTQRNEEAPSGAFSPPARPEHPAPPAQTAPKAAPLQPAEPALQHRAVAALFVAMLSLAGFLGFNINLRRGIFIVAYALLAGATALWLSLTAMSRARRQRTARPRGAVAATAIAGVGIGLSAAMLLAFVLFGQQLTGYGQCLSGANTIAAQQSCYSHFSRALNREIALLGPVSHR